MRTVEITGDNAEDYGRLISEDLIDDMHRTFYGGIGVVDDNDMPLGALIYELKGVDSEEKAITGVIRFASASNDETWVLLFMGYGSVVEKTCIETSFFETEDGTVSEVFKRHGFSFERKVSRLLRITLKDVENVKLNLKTRLPDYITGISSVSVMMFRNGLKNILYKGTRGAVEDLAYLPSDWYETEVSSCCITDGKINGLLLIRKTPSGSLIFVLYTCFGPGNRKNLAYMLIRTLNMMLSHYPPETEVMVNRRNDEIASLTKFLLTGRGEREVYMGIREEV